MPYCMKCKKKTKCKNLKLSSDSRGKARYEGHCAKCNTRCFKYAPSSSSSKVVHKKKSVRRKSKSVGRKSKSVGRKSKSVGRKAKGVISSKKFEPISPWLVEY